MADEENQQSPWTRPGFITAAVIVGVILIAGIVVTILALNRPTAPPPQPTGTSSAAPAPSPTAAAGGSSVCGLTGVELTGTVTQAPATTWKYQDVYAYPTSPTAGPGATTPSGYRYCFQHTPDGALFAAGNIAVMSSDPAIRSTWLPYVFSPGQFHDSLVSAATNASSSTMRMNIAGFRMLSYSGDTAVVDIAFQATSSGQQVTGSFVCNLIWSDGDWKVDSSTSNPTRVDQLPNVAGYTSWTAG
jgi:hypothetical protein